MIAKTENAVWHELIPGIRISTLVHGEKSLMARFILEAGATLPMHSHPHEQTGYLLSGSMTMTIGGEAYDFGPGDSWCIPGGVVHGATIKQACLAIEIFCPVREDYLPFLPGAK